MKAKIKATGEITRVMYSHVSQDEECDIIWYVTSQGAYFSKEELEFIDTGESLDYYTLLEHQYAGMAMQGMLAGTYYQGLSHDRVVKDAQYIAHVLVEKYKEEERK